MNISFFNLFLIASFLQFAFVTRVSSEKRIIGGELAFAGQFPFAAAIYVTTSNSKHFCGGTLTANQWVITSGHCVNNAVSFSIQLGSHHLFEEDENRVTVSTSTYILHPDFDPDSLEHDIGLIKLRMAIENTVYLHPIHPLGTELLDAVGVYVLGWGQTSDSVSGNSDELRYGYWTTISNEECRLYYGNQITDDMVCVSGNNNEGICTGDSGGALAIQLGRSYELVGIASFVSGEGCESVYPSGFVRIAPYYNWIVNITQETDDIV